MTKTIYNCKCWVIKDGSTNDSAQFCRKHVSSYVASDALADRVTLIEGFGEGIFGITEAQGGNGSWIPAYTQAL